MVNMNHEAVEFEIKRLQECCAQYRDDVKILNSNIEEYQQLIDEIIVALGSKGVLPSAVVENIERLVREKSEMQLIAGRYQYQFEHAMKALNAIDDLFEYAYKTIAHEKLQEIVRGYLATFTEAVKPKEK